MSKRFLSHDPETNTTEHVHLDGTGRAVIESIQDCEPVLEFNAQMADTLDKKQDWWRIGTIPNNVCVEWAQECGAKPFTKEWIAYAKRKLNDPDWAKLNPNRIRL